MIRIRVGLALTMMLGAMFASASLLTSVHDFGIGMAVTSIAVVAYAVCAWIEER